MEGMEPLAVLCGDNKPTHGPRLTMACLTTQRDNLPTVEPVGTAQPSLLRKHQEKSKSRLRGPVERGSRPAW